jgi:hypothetical protein
MEIETAKAETKAQKIITNTHNLLYSRKVSFLDHPEGSSGSFLQFHKKLHHSSVIF